MRELQVVPAFHRHRAEKQSMRGLKMLDQELAFTGSLQLFDQGIQMNQFGLDLHGYLHCFSFLSKDNPHCGQL
jgi:hypothetical protein